MTRGGGVSAVDVSEQLARRLRALGRAVSPEEIGELWIFPPLSDVEDSAEFLLFTRRLEEDRRRVYSARIAPGNGDGAGRPSAGHRPDGNGNGRRGGAEGSASRNGGEAPSRDGGGADAAPGQVVTEHGSVPSGRVHRLVDRFRRRLADDGEPLHVVIDGRRERWTRLLAEG